MPAGEPDLGNPFGTGKNVPKIAMAHGIPYVATASVAYVQDLEAKVTKAMSMPRRALSPHLRALPAGLGLGPQPDTVKLARLAVETGLFPLFEAEHGESPPRARSAARSRSRNTCKPQRRFAHLFKPTLGRPR
jgi:pyruvate ferredoxin oxidoreductase beta subunit